ncbi:hypothetical protein [Microvirga sp. 2MCAF35]|uniref:hypothetical protein n=1 Tax=Microvirga sp. 2MCAF35 TaxID=3232987 RepID=UPI003F9B4818
MATDRVRIFTLDQVETCKAPLKIWSVECLPGYTDPLTDESANHAVTIIRRIAPWLERIVFSPEIIDQGDKISGIYIPRCETICLSLWPSPPTILIAACHEAWHAIEERLSEDMIAAVDRDLGPAFFDGAPYFGNPEERRARAFETWCGRLLEGMPGRFMKSQHADAVGIDEIFAAAWSGQLGVALS